MHIVSAGARVLAAGSHHIPDVGDDVARAVASTGATRPPVSRAVLDSQAGDAAVTGQQRLLGELLALSGARQVRPTMAGPPVESLIGSDKAMAKSLGRSVADVRVAIHEVKDAGRFGGSRTNADIFLDPATGDLYPRISAKQAGPDAIGNIHDYL